MHYILVYVQTTYFAHNLLFPNCFYLGVSFWNGGHDQVDDTHIVNHGNKWWKIKTTGDRAEIGEDYQYYAGDGE